MTQREELWNSFLQEMIQANPESQRTEYAGPSPKVMPALKCIYAKGGQRHP